VSDLDDASEGVLLGSGGPGEIKVMHGESFFDIDSDAANAYIDGAKEVSVSTLVHLCPSIYCDFLQAAQAKPGRLREELAAIESRQRELKALLYARLGDNINLEDNPE